MPVTRAQSRRQDTSKVKCTPAAVSTSSGEGQHGTAQRNQASRDRGLNLKTEMIDSTFLKSMDLLEEGLKSIEDAKLEIRQQMKDAFEQVENQIRNPSAMLKTPTFKNVRVFHNTHKWQSGNKLPVVTAEPVPISPAKQMTEAIENKQKAVNTTFCITEVAPINPAKQMTEAIENKQKAVNTTFCITEVAPINPAKQMTEAIENKQKAVNTTFCITEAALIRPAKQITEAIKNKQQTAVRVNTTFCITEAAPIRPAKQITEAIENKKQAVNTTFCITEAAPISPAKQMTEAIANKQQAVNTTFCLTEADSNSPTKQMTEAFENKQQAVVNTTFYVTEAAPITPAKQMTVTEAIENKQQAVNTTFNTTTNTVSPDPRDNYNITVYEDFDEENKHRENKLVPEWASAKEKLHYQLFLCGPEYRQLVEGLHGKSDPIFPSDIPGFLLFPPRQPPFCKK